jgi:hypothetical protein
LRFLLWIAASFVSGFLFAMWAAEISVHWRNEEIHVSAPSLHFIAGSSLDRLKNGAAVPFDFQLLLWADSRNTPAARALERFVISYDVWEEKYAVTKLRGSAAARENKTSSHLTAKAAEAWCIENIALPAGNLPSGRPVFVRLEVRSVETRQSKGLVSDSGVSLTRLIEVFSNPVRGDQQHWAVESGPIKLEDLKRSARGS